MTPKSSLLVALALSLVLAIGGTSGRAAGFSLEGGVYALDVAAAFARAPAALDAAFAVIRDEMETRGVPPSEQSRVEEVFDRIATDMSTNLEALPNIAPVPWVGASLEVPLSLPIVDGVRIQLGFLTDSLIRAAAALAGTSIPAPLFEGSIEIDGDQVSARGDWGLATWMGSVDALARFDALFAALDIGVGIHWIDGRLLPSLTVDAPDGWDEVVNDAWAELHPDQLTWSSAGMHGMFGVEVGPPFFRVYGNMAFLAPISQSVNWWDLRVGRFVVTAGVVIRF